MSAEIWSFLTSGPFLTLVAALATGWLSYVVSTRQARISLDDVREKALVSAYNVGDQIRDELRLDLKEAKDALRAEQREFVKQVSELRQELAAAKRHISILERLRCPREDCTVFRFVQE